MANDFVSIVDVIRCGFWRADAVSIPTAFRRLQRRSSRVEKTQRPAASEAMRLLRGGGWYTSRRACAPGIRRGGTRREQAPKLHTPHGAQCAGRMGEITPSMFAGHSMLCPYDCKGKLPGRKNSAIRRYKNKGNSGAPVRGRRIARK